MSGSLLGVVIIIIIIIIYIFVFVNEWSLRSRLFPRKNCWIQTSSPNTCSNICCSLPASNIWHL